MTIVCATHFTDSSFNAVKVAAGLARRHRQPLHLVSVVPENTDREVHTSVNDALLLEAAALSSEGLDVLTSVLQGPLEGAVGQFCKSVAAQLLVVGDSSKQPSRLFAGTLDKFAFNVDLPLLVVRDDKPFDAWIRGSAPLKVVLALDHSWSSAVARDWVSRLSSYGPIDLVAAHVWWPADEYERRAMPMPKPEEAHAAISAIMKKETEAALEGLPANVKHRVHLEMSNAAVGDQLMALAIAEHAEVLVLGTNPHHGPMALLKSVSHDVLMNAPMSVACVPGKLTLPGLSTSLRESAAVAG